MKLEEIKFKDLPMNKAFVESYGGTFGNEIKFKVSDTEYEFMGYTNERYKIDPETIVYRI